MKILRLNIQQTLISIIKIILNINSYSLFTILSLMLPVQTDTQLALDTKVKKHAVVDFFVIFITDMGKEFNKTLNFLMGSKGPKASMITKELSDYENTLKKESEDTVNTMS